MAAPYTHLYSQATGYAEFRPSYPPDLYRKINAFAGFNGRPSLAVDIATGSGQAAVDLARHFEQVLAIDSDEAQLRAAKQAAGVEYRVGLAEATGVPSGAADLVASAAALHWFDHPRFWVEAARILRPGGTLACWGYNFGNFVGCPAATQVLLDFSSTSSGPLAPYWSQPRRLADNEYKDLVPDPSLFGETHRDVVFTSMKTSIAQTIGLASTWSAYCKFRQAEPDAPDPLVPFEQKLMAAFGADSGEDIDVEWRLYLLMAKKK